MTPTPSKSDSIFNMPIAVFNPDNLLQEMLDAKEGTVFLLGEKRTPNHEGDDTVEQTFVQIKRTKDTPHPTPSDTPKLELDEILEELGEAYNNNYPDKKAHNQAKAQIQSLILQAELRARVDELEGIKKCSVRGKYPYDFFQVSRQWVDRTLKNLKEQQ